MSREIAPESVEMIGVPADVPYDERIYRVNMNVGNLPASDRLVIEILSPQDEVLTHFLFNFALAFCGSGFAWRSATWICNGRYSGR